MLSILLIRLAYLSTIWILKTSENITLHCAKFSISWAFDACNMISIVGDYQWTNLTMNYDTYTETPEKAGVFFAGSINKSTVIIRAVWPEFSFGVLQLDVIQNYRWSRWMSHMLFTICWSNNKNLHTLTSIIEGRFFSDKLNGKSLWKDIMWIIWRMAGLLLKLTLLNLQHSCDSLNRGS